MSRHHRAHKRGWPRIRARAILDAGRRCTRCFLPGKLEVHHPTPLSKGGTHVQALEVLCRDCHFVSITINRTPRAWRGRSFLQEEFPC